MQETNKIPNCIGVIVDGNRRWAKARGLPTLEGHKAGYDKVKEFAIWAKDAGVKCVIAYVFSTENWNRSEEEVSYLMDLLRKMLVVDAVKWASEHGIRIRVAGSKARLAEDIISGIEKVQKETEKNDKLTMVFAMNYGGRDEIIEAVNNLIIQAEDTSRGEVTKEEFAKYLWTAGLPDPDMIIRTSGEHRLSNFLPWQSVYSEFFFPTFNFPDFDKEKFDALLEEFAARHRRFGK